MAREHERYSGDTCILDIDFLLPNGFLVRLPCHRNSTFGTVKDAVWQEAFRVGAAGLQLRDSHHYVFIGITRHAVEIVLHDDTLVKEIDDLIAPAVEVSEPMLERDRRRLEQNIGQAIDISVAQLDNTSKDNEEHKTARIRFKGLGLKTATIREKWTLQQQTLFYLPPKIDLNPDLPNSTIKKLRKDPDCAITINMWLIINGQHTSFTMRVRSDACPSAIVVHALDQHNQTVDSTPASGSSTNIGSCIGASIGASVGSSPRWSASPKEMDEYVLKRCECEEYLLEDRMIHTYEYVRQCISRGKTAQLQLVSKKDMLKQVPDNKCVSLQEGMFLLKRPSISNAQHISSWQIDENYSIIMRQMPVPKNLQNEYYVEAQIFHGEQELCPAYRTDMHSFNVTWPFQIAINALPRAAKLCFIVCPSKPSKKSAGRVRQSVNMQIFDHSGKMVTGCQELAAWSVPASFSRLTNPFGTPGAYTEATHKLKFDICAGTHLQHEIIHPGDDDIDKLISREQQYEGPEVPARDQTFTFEYLDRIHSREILTKMSSLEKEKLWEARYLAVEYKPTLLPRIVQCVDWSNRHQVFMLYQFLRGRQIQILHVALQLLGPEYPDARVRCLAVKYIADNLSPETLQLYLLQLVQAILFESYHDNDLVELLLKKALLYRHIGHRFFWLLRSEMYMPICRLRFGPILEAYCQYCGSAILVERLDEVQTIEVLNDVSHEVKDINTDDRLSDAQKLSRELEVLGKISARHQHHDNAQSKTLITNKREEMGEIQLDKCKVMRSKMRPIWVSGKNNSPLAATMDRAKLAYIAKHGDDLRQDMLVLQLLKTMDMIWKYTCHDYWMTLYDCMSTGDKFGIIEAVMDTMTVCDIHMNKPTSDRRSSLKVTASLERSAVTDPASIHRWMAETTGGGEKYLEAVQRFTYSCAAYTVAAYILGIGDRHSDNIMLKNEGELFHIDFGHFMGHRKAKGGIARERTHFVLTEEFVTIISRGKSKGNDSDFQEFLFLCYEAFMTIRQYGSLFLTMLNLMKHCNLPELNSDIDLQYCRDCLGLEKAEHEVAKDFYQKFMSSYQKQWMTNLNWFFHRFNRVMMNKTSGSPSS